MGDRDPMMGAYRMVGRTAPGFICLELPICRNIKGEMMGEMPIIM